MGSTFFGAPDTFMGPGHDRKEWRFVIPCGYEILSISPTGAFNIGPRSLQ